MSLQSQKCLEFNTSTSEQQKCHELRKGVASLKDMKTVLLLVFAILLPCVENVE